MMINILFLDIDGVLNSNEYAGSDRWQKKVENGVKFPDLHLDKNAINRINEYCKKTNSKIVISSTWRSMDDVEQVLKDNGLLIDIIGKTPYVVDGCRGDEIQKWLDNNEWDNYVIADDDIDMLKSQLDHFCYVDSKVGFVDEDIDKCIVLFMDNYVS